MTDAPRVEGFGDDLRVPYALGVDDNQPIGPQQAVKSRKYECPECRRPVRVRQGSKRRWHFYHATPPIDCEFEGESWQHAVAKHLIYWTIISWRRFGGPAPQVHRKCPKGHPIVTGVHDCVHDAAVERGAGHLTGGRIVVDVMLLNAQGKPIGGVEIWHAHQVDHRKAEKAANFRLIELLATDVLQDPLNWHPRFETVKRKDLVCEKCARIEEARQAKEAMRREIAERQRQREREEARLRAEFRAKSERLRVRWRKTRAYDRYKDAEVEKSIPEAPGCRIPMRSYQGQPYANVKLDCEDCDYCVEIVKSFSEKRQRPLATCVICSANQASTEDLRALRERVIPVREAEAKQRKSARRARAAPEESGTADQ
jgi:hypothetical protein